MCKPRFLTGLYKVYIKKFSKKGLASKSCLHTMEWDKFRYKYSMHFALLTLCKKMTRSWDSVLLCGKQIILDFFPIQPCVPTPPHRGQSITTWTWFCPFFDHIPTSTRTFFTIKVDNNRLYLTPTPHILSS